MQTAALLYVCAMLGAIWVVTYCIKNNKIISILEPKLQEGKGDNMVPLQLPVLPFE